MNRRIAKKKFTREKIDLDLYFSFDFQIVVSLRRQCAAFFLHIARVSTDLVSIVLLLLTGVLSIWETCSFLVVFTLSLDIKHPLAALPFCLS